MPRFHQLIPPHGTTLTNLIVPENEKLALKLRCAHLPSLTLSRAAANDFELLASGAYSPLRGYLNRRDYECVIDRKHLADGTLWPSPIVLSAPGTGVGQELALRDSGNHLLGSIRVDEVYSEGLISGPLQVFQLPRHFDFPQLRRMPAQVRSLLATMEHPDVVAQEDLQDGAQLDGYSRLIQPAAGWSRLDDFDHFDKLRRLSVTVAERYSREQALFSICALNLESDPILRALVQRNYGANYVLTRDETEFELLNGYRAETGVTPLLGNAPVEPAATKGFCLWITGLPSAGKTTISEILAVLLMERGRRVTLLDGDVVRSNLSKGLGFSRSDRETNILRIGFVATEIVRHDGVAICAAVSPYRASRQAVRGMAGTATFIEIFVDTPQAICEQRDVKGLYAKARAGNLPGFTGIDDPYEAPLAPEVHLHAASGTPESNALRVIEFLESRGLL